MTLDDFDEFSKVVMGFAELKGKKLSPPAIKLYFRAMQHWSLDEFKLAAEQLLRTSTFMPTPKEFEDLRKAGDLTAGEAWELVKSGAMLEVGSRTYRAAQIVGGQYYIRHADTERDLPFIERRFLQAFADLEKVDPVREALPQIVNPEARIALSRPVSAGRIVDQLFERPEPAKPEMRALPAPQPKAKDPPKSPREKITALVKLHADFTAEDIARIAGESVETVREVMAELENAA